MTGKPHHAKVSLRQGFEYIEAEFASEHDQAEGADHARLDRGTTPIWPCCISTARADRALSDAARSEPVRNLLSQIAIDHAAGVVLVVAASGPGLMLRAGDPVMMASMSRPRQLGLRVAVRHVVDNDDGDDAADGRTCHPHLRRDEPEICGQGSAQAPGGVRGGLSARCGPCSA